MYGKITGLILIGLSLFLSYILYLTYFPSISEVDSCSIELTENRNDTSYKFLCDSNEKIYSFKPKFATDIDQVVGRDWRIVYESSFFWNEVRAISDNGTKRIPGETISNLKDFRTFLLTGISMILIFFCLYGTKLILRESIGNKFDV